MSRKRKTSGPVMSSQDLRALLASSDEDAVHLAVAEHLRRRAKPSIFWAHVPNGGLRHPLVGKKLKAMGTRAGFPDFYLLIDGRSHFLELKAEAGKVSAEQHTTMAELVRAGGVCSVGRGLNAALGVLEAWGVFR
jgi:hypothetical protein